MHSPPLTRVRQCLTFFTMIGEAFKRPRCAGYINGSRRAHAGVCASESPLNVHDYWVPFLGMNAHAHCSHTAASLLPLFQAPTRLLLLLHLLLICYRPAPPAPVHHWLQALGSELEERVSTDREDNERLPQLLTVYIDAQAAGGASSSGGSSKGGSSKSGLSPPGAAREQRGAGPSGVSGGGGGRVGID